MFTSSGHLRIAVTGGSGYLGGLTCRHLDGAGHKVRSLDLVPPDPVKGAGEHMQADLASYEDIRAAFEGIDLVIHLGADLSEDDWAGTRDSNIVGTYNVFEAARQTGVRRIVYASSHHVSGMYPVTRRLDLSASTRPDSLYGLSKAFAEQVGQYYWDKYGLESVGLRIGAVRPVPGQTRERYVWMSEPDYLRLIEASMTAPRVEHSLVWGVSNNDAAWWDNADARHLGFAPRDNAADHPVTPRPDDARLLVMQGGKRALFGLKASGPGE